MWVIEDPAVIYVGEPTQSLSLNVMFRIIVQAIIVYKQNKVKSLSRV